MKKLIILFLIALLYSNLSYANNLNSCGSNIKNGVAVCYDLKSYNKNPKISLKFGDDGFEEVEKSNNNNPENIDWSINYNLNAVLIYGIVVKKNNKILSVNKFQELVPIDTEYDLYDGILGINSKLGGALVVEYGLLPENFHYSYSAKLSTIIKKYDKANEDELEIKKSEYIIKSLTPLLKPEQDKLKKIEDKKSAILGDDYNNYINSIKEKYNQTNNKTIQELEDEANQIPKNIEEINNNIYDLESALTEEKNIKTKRNSISEQQSKLEKSANNYNNTSRMFDSISGKKAKREKEWNDLEKQREEQQAKLDEYIKKYGYDNDIKKKIEELNGQKITLNERYTTIQTDIETAKNSPPSNETEEELSSALNECTIATFHKAEEYDKSDDIAEAKERGEFITSYTPAGSYSYKKIRTTCYSNFITDENKLDTLNTIDNLYIKQHKKVQFIINTIAENKSNIVDYKKKIEDDKSKKALEKELGE